jgi:phosphomethylpyrimidine synthase
MKITQDVRDYAAARGLTKCRRSKPAWPEERRVQGRVGGEFYVPVDALATKLN